MERCYIKGPMTDEESISFFAAVTNDPLHGFHMNNYCVLRQEVANSIDEVGGFVQITMDELRSSSTDADKEAHDYIISTIANFLLQLVSGISNVCAERDNRNNSGDQLPPVLPLDLCVVLSRDFVSCLGDQRIRLRHNFSEEEVGNIDEQVLLESTWNLFVFGKKSTVASVKPTFDKATETWQKSAADDGQYPYDAVGALLRHGPSPFLKRITDPKGYEQSVLQYMAATGCSRAEATGNMDAKLNNAADWAYQKLEEKKTGKKVDYTVLDAKDAALTIIWALGITPLVLYSIAQTASQFGTGPSVIKY
ncbi:hypothetical protein IV203_033992 [Nitzschia inconspicua]|uniref:Uncharacterized protein n=1 Tax=Nitzschia inconspicua TaxID=303405 RepID=A0A9K3M2U7_9STRA|nr:hypothetical protein IV203_033992 [Nitzschia inconspicua]